MIVSRYKIGNKEMVITKDDDGELVSVTDENSVKVKKVSMDKVKLTSEFEDDVEKKFRSPTKHVSNDTFILTQHNPTCGWYFWNRRWYYL